MLSLSVSASFSLYIKIDRYIHTVYINIDIVIHLENDTVTLGLIIFMPFVCI